MPPLHTPGRFAPLSQPDRAQPAATLPRSSGKPLQGRDAADQASPTITANGWLHQPVSKQNAPDAGTSAVQVGSMETETTQTILNSAQQAGHPDALPEADVEQLSDAIVTTPTQADTLKHKSTQQQHAEPTVSADDTRLTDNLQQELVQVQVNELLATAAPTAATDNDIREPRKQQRAGLQTVAADAPRTSSHSGVTTDLFNHDGEQQAANMVSSQASDQLPATTMSQPHEAAPHQAAKQKVNPVSTSLPGTRSVDDFDADVFEGKGHTADINASATDVPTEVTKLLRHGKAAVSGLETATHPNGAVAFVHSEPHTSASFTSSNDMLSALAQYFNADGVAQQQAEIQQLQAKLNRQGAELQQLRMALTEQDR